MMDTLHEQEVHLWIADLDALGNDCASYSQFLSPEEHSRKERFAFEILKKRFAVARGILRFLLQRYLGVQNELIRFSTGPYGKPFLKHNPRNLQFNLSHSERFAVFGFTMFHQLGVNIEYVRADWQIGGAAEYLFSDSEKKAFSRLMESERKQAFLMPGPARRLCLKPLEQVFQRL